MGSVGELLGDSAPLVAVREQVARLLRRGREGARRLPPVLILGETGTGKGLLASAIHRAGPRPAGPFVEVNCAAIPETLLEAELFGFERGAFTDARHAKPGLFQTAHRGMLFLDEVGLLPEGLQAKLLKVLEEQSVRRLGSTRSEPVDVWLLAATGEDLEAAVRARRFREDLYHRLAVVTLRLPPLRERGDDILRLAEHFLDRACEDYGLTPRSLTADAQAALRAHPWPGNVRELANVMERVALLADEATVTAAMLVLPTSPDPRGPAPGVADERQAVVEAEAEAERGRLLEALRTTKWNISRAAARLGIPRSTLRSRMDKLGLGTAASAPRRLTAPTEASVGVADGTHPPALEVEGSERSGVRWEPRRVTFLRARLVSLGVDPASSEIRRAMEVLVDKAQSFGGRVDELSPAGIVAVFGIEPVEDAPRRAAHAAMAIENAVARKLEGGRARPAMTLAIHTAELLVGRIGDDLEIDADAKRIAGTVCDALVDRADPGMVLVSESAAPFLRRRFDLASHGAVEGVPGSVYRLRGTLEADRGFTRFVGREGELLLLAARLEQMRAGQGQIVLLVGDPGIGKSRLLRELRRRVAGTATWLEGHALSFGRTMTFHPMIDLLRRAFGIDEGDSEAAMLAKIEDYVLALDEDLRPTLPFLRYLLALDPGDAEVAAMEPDMRRARIFDASCRLFLRAAEVRPLVIVYEDVHWMDQATEEYLALMAASIATRRVLMILTSRPGYSPPFADRSYHSRLALQTLSEAESIELACGLLTSEALPDELQTLVVRKAEGNPFFLEEVIRSLQEVGALRRDDGRVVVIGRLDDFVVPDSIQEVLLARVERLEAAPRRVLQVASVIGKEVPFGILRAIADLPEESLRHELTRLQAAEFLYEVRLFPELEYTFKHALTHEVAYGSLLGERRRALHAKIVEALELLYTDRLLEYVERLAHHAFRGEVWDKAVTYLRQAGAKAAARSAYHEAAADSEQALVALRHLPETPEKLRRGIDLRFDLRSSLQALGEHERVFEHLRDAESLASALGDQDRLGWASAYLSQYLWPMGDPGRAEALGQRALTIASGLGDVALRVVATFFLGQGYFNVGDYGRAIDHCQQNVVAIKAERTHERLGLTGLPSVLSRIWLAWCFAEQGDFAEAMVHADTALSIAEAAGQPYSMAVACLCLGQVQLVRGALAQAILVLERGAGLCQAWNLRLILPTTAAALGLAYALSGRVVEALPVLEEGEAQASPVRIIDTSTTRSALSVGYLLAGKFDEAAGLASRAAELAAERGFRGYQARVSQLLGEISARRHPPDMARAEDHYGRGLALADELGMRPLVAHCHLGLGRVCQGIGDRRRAEGHLAAAAGMYREMDMPYWLVQAEVALRDLG